MMVRKIPPAQVKRIKTILDTSSSKMQQPNAACTRIESLIRTCLCATCNWLLHPAPSSSQDSLDPLQLALVVLLGRPLIVFSFTVLFTLSLLRFQNPFFIILSQCQGNAGCFREETTEKRCSTKTTASAISFSAILSWDFRFWTAAIGLCRWYYWG